MYRCVSLFACLLVLVIALCQVRRAGRGVWGVGGTVLTD